jgi:HEAT repeat protein
MSSTIGASARSISITIGRPTLPPAVPALIAILDHKSEGVRSYAADALGGIVAEGRDAVLAVAPNTSAQLFAHIRNQGDSGYYLDDVFHALGNLEALNHDAIPDLIEFLDHDSPSVRARAAASLGSLRPRPRHRA